MWRLIDFDGSAPFPIKRVYYLYGTKADRGGHSHRELEQIAVSLHGGVTFILEDESGRCEVRLNDPKRGLFIGPGTWREMKDFTPDNVLVVLASKHYDEADYIRDFTTFRLRQTTYASEAQ